MDKENTFSYRYSAKENKEVEEIRKKYLPESESKLDELKRLDYTVQTSGIAPALCAGTSGMLVFGLGLCLAMGVIGSGVFLKLLGVLIGVVGIIGIFIAYPIYQKSFDRTKARLAPRIIELADELSITEK